MVALYANNFDSQYRLKRFTARSSYASAVLEIVILSVRPSVWDHMGAF